MSPVRYLVVQKMLYESIQIGQIHSEMWNGLVLLRNANGSPETINITRMQKWNGYILSFYPASDINGCWNKTTSQLWQLLLCVVVSVAPVCLVWRSVGPLGSQVFMMPDGRPHTHNVLPSHHILHTDTSASAAKDTSSAPMRREFWSNCCLNCSLFSSAGFCSSVCQLLNVFWLSHHLLSALGHMCVRRPSLHSPVTKCRK